MFTLTFETTNDAFVEDSDGESARILHRVADMVRMGRTSGNVYDANGNTVGTWSRA